MNHERMKCMWGSVLVSVLASLMIFLLSGCLATDQGANRNTNESVQVNADLPSGGDLIEIDSYEFADAYCGNLIKEISPKLGLAPLAKTAARLEEFVFRLWTNLGGLGDAKLLIVRSGGNENRAEFFDIQRALDPIRFRKERPADPKSGWHKLPFEVKNRLTTPKGLVRDPNFHLNRDEPVILLEVLDKGEYRRVLYGKNTSFQDGKRLIEVCEYLGSEFDVDMNCRG